MRFLGSILQYIVWITCVINFTYEGLVFSADPVPSSQSALPAQVPKELARAGIVEHLGTKISIEELKFKNEKGEPVFLGDFFKRGRPVILSLVYYECPNLCTFVLNGLTQSLKSLDWTPGKQFEIVTVSINPHESPELASAKKSAYLKAYGRSEAGSGWHFLTGEESQIQQLASQVGFGYEYDPREKQYAHSAAIFALTPDGRVSRYLYGIEFSKKDLKLALLEASSGKIGTVIERLLLFCYRYDPQTRKYSVYLTQLMRLGCGITVLILGSYLFVFWRRQRKGA